MSSKKRQQAQRKRTQRQQKRNARKARRHSPRIQTAVARGSRPAEPDTPPEAGLQRWSRLLTKADRDPDSVLGDPRCLKPPFVKRFFDLCDAKALEAPAAAGEYAESALALATKLGDRHHENLAQGIAVHASISNQRWPEADQRLQDYRQEAFDCCPTCTSDWLRRQGDLLVETLDPELSRDYLKMAAEALGDDLDDDSRGRILFVRGIAHHFLRDRHRALADAGEALRILSLETPPAYFIDDLAMVGCFLQHATEREHFETAAAHLTSFRERIKGLKGKDWLVVRDRLRWVLALVDAWLGHSRRSRLSLERIRAKHIKHSPHRYALAIAVDEALIYCLHQPEVHIRSIRAILAACKRQLKLEPEIRQRLRMAARDLGKASWRAREILVALRRSYIVPVAGLLTDRVLAAAAAESCP